MTLRTGLLSGKVIQQDHDLSALMLNLLQGSNAAYKGNTINGLAVTYNSGTTTISVTKGTALVKCTRTGSDYPILAVVYLTTDTTVVQAGPVKVWLEVKQSHINDGLLHTTNGDNITELKTGTTYPSSNYLPLAEINGAGVVTTISTPVVGINDAIQNAIDSVVAGSVAFGDITADSLTLPGGDVQGQIDDIISGGVPTSNFVDISTYILGEDCLENDSLFVESLPTFAESTGVQNIGDITANTKVVLYSFGSGVASNTKKLALKKFVSPSPNLSIRLETLDSSDNPTGVLVHANATAVIASSSLTTSLVDTTITFAGSFTIPLGQKYAIVLAQVGNVVNGTNYYGVGYVARDTSIRGVKSWDGSTYSNVINLLGNVSDNGGGFNATVSLNGSYGQVIVTNKNIYISQLSKDGSCTATRARVFLNGGGLLATATFSGNVATLSTPLYVVSGTSLRVEYDNNGSNYTLVYNNSSPTFPSGTNISYITGSNNQGAYSSNANISSITSYEASVKVFPYVSSNLSIPKILSKTSALYSYKLPIDFIRVANEAKSRGNYVTSTYSGLRNGFSGLSQVAYYASNSPGLISSAPGAIVYKIGEGIDNDTMNISYSLSPSNIIKSGSIGSLGSIDSGGILVNKDMVVSIDCFRTSGASGSITVTLYEGVTSSPTDIVAQSLSYDSAIGIINIRYQSATIKRGNYYRYVISGNSNLGTGTYSISIKQR